MSSPEKRHRVLRLLVDINWDRLLYIATIATALLAGAFFGSIALG